MAVKMRVATTGVTFANCLLGRKERPCLRYTSCLVTTQNCSSSKHHMPEPFVWPFVLSGVYAMLCHEKKHLLILFTLSWPTHRKQSWLTWKTVTMAHSRESKFFRSGTVSPVSVLRLNLQPKMCIPKMLFGQEVEMVSSINISATTMSSSESFSFPPNNPM